MQIAVVADIIFIINPSDLFISHLKHRSTILWQNKTLVNYLVPAAVKPVTAAEFEKLFGGRLFVPFFNLHSASQLKILGNSATVQRRIIASCEAVQLFSIFFTREPCHNQKLTRFLTLHGSQILFQQSTPNKTTFAIVYVYATQCCAHCSAHTDLTSCFSGYLAYQTHQSRRAATPPAAALHPHRLSSYR